MNYLYQTLEDRNNPEYIDANGPFKCRKKTSWLGDGYYFWDSFIELAHFWGKNSGYTNYVICHATADLNEELCYDLASNISHIKDMRNIVDRMVSEGYANKGTTVKRIIEFMKKIHCFTHYAVRILGTSSIAANDGNESFLQRFKFDEKLPAYLDLIPPIQVCIYDCTKVSLNSYQIIYPDIYTDDYLV
ncbi:hypothetical protein [Chryseobacterium hagamense]|uniref:Uncharacterized protein n=1 Tax=Chryseobacterium hagamense TaxID=395935 RepID=A0A511YQM1_9FLAO|nr:hypothetical protein [Chryseobacterium hagamense]GEN77493.1 hypothetical protein CHA01nite_32330 [Chryseobacterium hagamense]